MEIQNQEYQKPNPDHVVIFMDQPNAKVNQSTPQQEESKDPNFQTPARTKTLRRLNFSKPKSRFAETNYPPPSKTIPESEEYQPLNPPESTTSTDEDDDDDEWYENEEEEEAENGDAKKGAKNRKKRKRKINKRALIEFILFLIIMTGLICSLTQKSLKDKVKWGLVIWKWCLMVMVLFCGRLGAGWLVGLLVFFIERNFMLREKVLYFVYGLRKSFQNCAWLGLVLIGWMIMFHDVHKHHHVLKKVFRALIAVLIGATIWLLKILLVKVLASSFHVATFFDRMKESVFHHYILDALAGPELEEDEREAPQRRTLQHSKTLPARLRERPTPPSAMALSRSKRFVSRRIDMERLRKLSIESRATAWSVKRLVNYVRSSGLSTISRTVDAFGESEINSEWEARTSAQRIFKNVAKHGAK